MKYVPYALAVAILAAPLAAHATGDATCDSGPQSGWKPKEELTKMLTDKGWKVRMVKPDGGCYEVYGMDENGKKVEAYFHPVTLESVPSKKH